jgi:integrase
MATRTKLTKRICEQAPPAKGRIELRDTEMPGLVLRISSAGGRTWFYYYRDRDGIERKPKLGEFPKMSVDEAREEARTHGKPKPEEVKFGTKLKDLMELYKAKELDPAAQPTTLDKFNRYLNLLGNYGGRAMGALTRADMYTLHDDIKASNGAITAMHVLSYISTAWNWGIQRDLAPFANYALKMEQPKMKKRQRTLEPEERATILGVIHKWKCDPQTEWHTRVALFVLELIHETGVRVRAVTELKKANVKRKAKHPIMTFLDKALPLSGEKTPVDRAITTQCADILDRVPESSTDYVFQGERNDHISYAKVWSVWDAIRIEAGCPDARIHDFRRTFITDSAVDGDEDFVTVSKVVGHKSVKTTQGYFEMRPEQRVRVEQKIADKRTAALKAVS